MNQQFSLENIAALATIATPFIVLLFSGLGWVFAKRFEKNWESERRLRERANQLEEKLRENRVSIYQKALEPFILSLTKDQGLPKTREFKNKSASEAATEEILSLDYKQNAFQLLLIGSDDVVKVFGNLMQFFCT